MATHRAFTLIEVLVVIAVIALLVTILVPSLSKAREMARATVCRANMRNMAVATLMYVEDQALYLPSVGLSHGSHQLDEQGSWLRLLQRYSGTDLLYRCPSDRSPYFDVPEPVSQRLRKLSYGTNYYVSGEMTGYEKYNRLSAIERPFHTIFAAELAETGEFATADHIHAGWWIMQPPADQVAVDRHLGRANYSLLDGRAEAFTVEETFRLAPNSGPGRLIWITNKYDPTVAR